MDANMKQNIVVVIVIIIGIAVGWLVFGRGTTQEAEALGGFAQCLTERGFTMYGAYWCPHCQNEKAAFGSSFKKVNYVECTKEPDRCIAAGIKGYPTWITNDGRRFEGEQGVERLAQASGCPVK